ncbi:MAG: bacillithiol system redox-active protein YtxJ [Pyrinomonadaceae bacterium]
MQAKFDIIADTKMLEKVLSNSNEAPVVVFKHSTTCPISSAAYKQMSQFTAAPIALVVVQNARSVSNEVAARTGVAHESPQAIVVQNGKAVWSASHYDITADAVTEVVERHAAAASSGKGSVS